MKLSDSLHLRMLIAVLALLLTHSVSSAQAESRKVVVQGDGLAAGQDANIAGDVTFGITAKDVHALLEERMRFRSEHVDQLEKIGQSLKLGECAVVELVRRISRDGEDAALRSSHLIDLTNRHDAVVTTADSLDAQDPKAVAVKQRVLEANREGNLEQAEQLLIEMGKADTLISVRQGIAAGRDINIQGDVVFGVPKKAFESLVEEMQQQEGLQFGRLQQLSEDLSVNRCATASFLKILGEKQVPTEQLHAKLKEIAGRHLELVSQLRAMTTQDPDIETLRKQAAEALDAGDYETAEQLLKEAQEIAQAKFQLASPQMIDSALIAADQGQLHLTRLHYGPAADSFDHAAEFASIAGKREDQVHYQELAGGAYQDAGIYRKAESAFLDVLEWREKNPDQSSVAATITTLNNLGGLYLSSSDYANAIKSFEKAQLKAESSPDLEPRVRNLLAAASHSGAADAAVARSDLIYAEEHYTLALSLLETEYGADDSRLAPLITNWARLKTIRGDYAEAETLYRRAMQIDAVRRKAGNLESAVTMNNLATLYYARGEYESAEDLWWEVIEIYRSTLGEDHFITLGVHQNLARTLRKHEDSGHLACAETIYKHALNIWKQRSETRNVEADHLVIASLFASLADLEVAQKRFDEAEEHYEKALDIVDSRLDRKHRKQHLLIASYHNDLAVVYERQKKYPDAADVLTEAREIMALKLGTQHPNYGTVSSNLARVLMRLGRLDEAEPIYLTAITIAEQTQRPLQVAARRRRLATLYREQGELALARENLEIARDLYASELSPEHAKTQALERELTELCEGRQP